jgi:hypothetical protein
MDGSERRPDRDPVRTTIVGGQTAVRTKAGPPVPVGIERCLHRAASDARFRQSLLADRARAARKARLGLTPAEEALLDAVSPEQLDQLIAQTPPPAAPRRHFLQMAFGWVAALLGGATVAGGCRRNERPGPATMGVRMDEPPPGPATKGERPDVPPPEPEPETPPDAPPPVRGIRPDVPPKGGADRGVSPDIPPEKGE